MARRGPGPLVQTPPPPPPPTLIPTPTTAELDRVTEPPEERIADEALGDLAWLEDEQALDVTWSIYRVRPDHQGGATPGLQRSPGSFVCKVTGPIDLEQLKTRIGGGTFRVIGRRGQRYYRNVLIELEGQVRLSESERVAEASTVTSSAINELTAKVDRLADQLAARAPSGQSDSMQTLLAAVELVSKIRPSSEGAPIDTAIGILTKGIELGAQRRSHGVDWVGVIDKVAPHLRDVASVLVESRRRAPVVPMRAVEAVATTERVAATPATPSTPSPRFAVLIEKVAAELARGESAEPEVIAVAAEIVLNDDELERMCGNTPAAVCAWLRTAAETYPVFRGEQLEGFVAKVLTVLNAEDSSAAS